MNATIERESLDQLTELPFSPALREAYESIAKLQPWVSLESPIDETTGAAIGLRSDMTVPVAAAASLLRILEEPSTAPGSARPVEVSDSSIFRP